MGLTEAPLGVGACVLLGTQTRVLQEALRGGPGERAPSPALQCRSVHRGRLVALSGVCVLGEGRLLVIVHRRARVRGVGRVGVWGWVHIVLNEGVHASLVALVGQGGQGALKGDVS